MQLFPPLRIFEVSRFGWLDLAFNNASTEGKGAPAVDETGRNYDGVLGPNAKGTLLSMKHEIRAMQKSGGGVIAKIASIVGHVGFPGASVYTASKHAGIGLTRAAALERAKGIRVNVVSPGAVITDIMERFVSGSEEINAGFAAIHPIRRVGRPEEIAGTVIFLCSSPARRALSATAKALRHRAVEPCGRGIPRAVTVADPEGLWRHVKSVHRPRGCKYGSACGSPSNLRSPEG